MRACMCEKSQMFSSRSIYGIIGQLTRRNGIAACDMRDKKGARKKGPNRSALFESACHTPRGRSENKSYVIRRRGVKNEKSVGKESLDRRMAVEPK